MTIEERVSLAPFTTFKIGGPARFFARATSVDELAAALAFANKQHYKVFILGGGSNVLVEDRGFDGLVIKIEFAGVEHQGATYIVHAGESWDALVARTVADGMWGLENLSGIPGTVGGAVVQNIGAYGAALSSTCVWVEAFDTQVGELVRLGAAECAFDYRMSLFKHAPGRYVVVRAAFELAAHGAPNLTYRDVAARFAGATPTLPQIRQTVLDIRGAKFPNLSREGTAGSFFLNPVVPEAQAKALNERYPEMPLFAMPETTHVKVPLGWLLDKVLAVRGMQVGGARVYEQQALVIAAAEGSTAHDVKQLAHEIQTLVQQKIGLKIVAEVTIL